MTAHLIKYGRSRMSGKLKPVWNRFDDEHFNVIPPITVLLIIDKYISFVSWTIFIKIIIGLIFLSGIGTS